MGEWSVLPIHYMQCTHTSHCRIWSIGGWQIVEAFTAATTQEYPNLQDILHKVDNQADTMGYGQKISSTSSDSGGSPINPCIDLHHNDSSIESHAQGHVIWSERNQMEAKFDKFVALTNEFEEFMTQTYTCFRQEQSQWTTHNLWHGVLHYNSHR